MEGVLSHVRMIHWDDLCDMMGGIVFFHNSRDRDFGAESAEIYNVVI